MERELKRERMRIWACDKFRFCAETPKEIASSAITNLASNANRSFGVYNDPGMHCTIVVGVNKPDNLSLLGIIWEDLGSYEGT